MKKEREEYYLEGLLKKTDDILQFIENVLQVDDIIKQPDIKYMTDYLNSLLKRLEYIKSDRD
jgi:hypothetical protein